MEIALIVLGMAVVTYLPRVLPMLKSLDPEFGFLKYIPVAIFASLVFPELLLNEHRVLAVDYETLAGLVALVAAWKSRNLLLTMLAGLAALYVLRNI